MKLRFVSVLLSVALLAGCFSDTASYAPVVRLGVGPKQAPSVYVVKRGDTLYGIAWTYGIDDTAIVRMNHLQPPFHVWPGERLVLRQSMMIARVESPVVMPSVMTSHWIWPVRGRLIRGFTPGLTGNAGIDIAGFVGQPIEASQAGSVVYSGDGIRGYGNLIIIKQGSDYLSAYAFNQQNLVRVGDFVKQGQTIAVMGRDNTGVPALHFEIRFDGKPIDPLQYLH